VNGLPALLDVADMYDDKLVNPISRYSGLAEFESADCKPAHTSDTVPAAVAYETILPLIVTLKVSPGMDDAGVSFTTWATLGELPIHLCNAIKHSPYYPGHQDG
jgi:hypothetical protein